MALLNVGIFRPTKVGISRERTYWLAMGALVLPTVGYFWMVGNL